MYAKVKNGSIDKFPYTASDLRTDNPSVSFPRVPTLSDLVGWDVVAVEQLADPTHDTALENLVQGFPVLNGARWEVTRVVVTKSQEEIDAYAAKATRDADRTALKVDAAVVALLKARPTAINTYIENNVNSLAEAKTVLKIFGRALAVVAHGALK